jgi:hypothetical protein
LWRVTGSHEVRGSIPLGSTNIFNKLGAAIWLPLLFCVPIVCQLQKISLECACRLKKKVFELRCGRLLHRRQHMRISIEREHNRSMSRHGLVARERFWDSYQLLNEGSHSYGADRKVENLEAVRPF